MMISDKKWTRDHTWEILLSWFGHWEGLVRSSIVGTTSLSSLHTCIIGNTVACNFYTKYLLHDMYGGRLLNYNGSGLFHWCINWKLCLSFVLTEYDRSHNRYHKSSEGCSSFQLLVRSHDNWSPFHKTLETKTMSSSKSEISKR